MTTVVIRSGNDAMVRSARPWYEYGGPAQLMLDSGEGEVLLFMPIRPAVPRGATIVSATLEVRQTAAWTAVSRTLSATRNAAGWKPRTVNWNNKPALTGTAATVVSSAAGTAGTVWAFDVTAHVASWYANGANYGWRITTNDATARYIKGFSAAGGKPALRIVYTVPPAAPTDLAPASGRAVSVAKPTVEFEAQDFTSLQVQIDPSGNFTAPPFDSGEVFTTAPLLDLSGTWARTATVTTTSASTTVTAASGTFAQADVGATITGTGIPGGATITAFTSSTQVTISAAATASGSPTATITRSYAGLSVGATTQWRVRVKNDNGWGAWSDAVSFTRTAKITVTVTNPLTTDNDPTPLITWTATGQQEYRVLLRDPDGYTIDDSGWRASTTQFSYIPENGATADGETHRTIVRVRDAVLRESSPGDPAYAEGVKDWSFVYSATPTPLTALTASQSSMAPWVTLNFSRAALPDGGWVVTRQKDGTGKFKVVARLDPTGDVESLGGGNYRWTDYTAAPNHLQTYRIAPIVNGDAGSGGPTAAITPAVSGIWLVDPEEKLDCLILGKDEPEAAYGEASETFYPLGRGTPLTVTSNLRGLEGGVSGLIAPSPYGRTFVQELAALEAFRLNPTGKFRLAYGDVNIPVRVWGIDPAPRRVGTAGGRVNRRVGFRFAQNGELPRRLT